MPEYLSKTVSLHDPVAFVACGSSKGGGLKTVFLSVGIHGEAGWRLECHNMSSAIQLEVERHHR